MFCVSISQSCSSSMFDFEPGGNAVRFFPFSTLSKGECCPFFCRIFLVCKQHFSWVNITTLRNRNANKKNEQRERTFFLMERNWTAFSPVPTPKKTQRKTDSISSWLNTDNGITDSVSPRLKIENGNGTTQRNRNAKNKIRSAKGPLFDGKKIGQPFPLFSHQKDSAEKRTAFPPCSMSKMEKNGQRFNLAQDWEWKWNNSEKSKRKKIAARKGPFLLAKMHANFPCFHTKSHTEK